VNSLFDVTVSTGDTVEQKYSLDEGCDFRFCANEEIVDGHFDVVVVVDVVVLVV